MSKSKKSSDGFGYRLLGDRLAVQRLAPEEASAGGILIPDVVVTGRPDRGVVIAAGEGRMRSDSTLVPMRVKKGDVVLYNSRIARAIVTVPDIDGEVDIMTEQDIIAVEK